MLLQVDPVWEEKSARGGCATSEPPACYWLAALDEAILREMKSDHAVDLFQCLFLARSLAIEPEVGAACYEKIVLGLSDANLQIVQLFLVKPFRLNVGVETACSS